LVVAVRRLSRRWKVKTLLAGSSPTSPMRRRLPTPLFPTLPFGNRSLQTPLFLKLPRLKLPSSPGSYTEQYHMKLIRLPEACPRSGGYAFVYRLSPPEAIHGWCFCYTVCPRPRLSTVGYPLLYRLSPPEAIHGWLSFFIPFALARGYPRLAILFYTVCPRPRLSTVGYPFIYRLPSPEAVHGFHLDPPLPSLRRHTFTA